MVELASGCDSTDGGKKGETEMMAMLRRKKRMVLVLRNNWPCLFIGHLVGHKLPVCVVVSG
jgi:hypothetical protein